MNKKIKAALLSALIFPGLGQIYKGRRLKGCLIIIAVNVILLIAFGILIKGVYLLSLSPDFSETADPAMIARQLLAENPAFNWLTGIFSCLWLYGVLDALLGNRKDGPP